ncbi:alpha-amylase family glycosyl hydrolase, partial [uncultured Ruminococcus sp.]
MKNDIITEFINGQSCRAYEALGAVKTDKGIRFSTYAPHARNVELCLNGDILPMERDQRGVWTTVCAAKEGDIYQYVITTPTLEKHYRSDPFAVYSEVRPQNASVVYDIDSYSWNDDEWLSKRDKCYEKPMNIYEVHFGSWRIKEGKEETERFYTYEEMIDLLIPYVKEMGYTHIELLPLTEYPFDGSWGYQVSGYFSATSRYGDPRGLMKFIDACHEEGIGVILDFVPVHFVRDFYALHIYDGGFLFESDNEYDRYSEWGTALFDYSKPHVLSFVKSSVNFWIEKYHVDGLRYDAVANLIYRHGHTDDAVNDSGIWFLKNTNYTIQKMHPDVMLFAEDSTNYTKVTAPVEFGGLGFDYKWDLGFMNDTIDYIKTPPYERRNHHNKMTFSMSYFYNDLFILPYSHDEVVHGKKTMVDKVFGSQQE